MPDLSYEEFVAAQRWPVASIDRPIVEGFRRNSLPQERRIEITRVGIAGDSIPGLLPVAWSPYADARRSRFEGLQNLLGPKVIESPLLGYKRMQGGFERASVGKKAAKVETNVLSKRRKIPTASTAA